MRIIIQLIGVINLLTKSSSKPLALNPKVAQCLWLWVFGLGFRNVLGSHLVSLSVIEIMGLIVGVTGDSR